MNILIQCLKLLIFISWVPYIILPNNMKVSNYSVFIPIVYEFIICIIFIEHVPLKINLLSISLGLIIGILIYLIEYLIGFKKVSYYDNNKKYLSKEHIVLYLLTPFPEELFFRVLAFQYIFDLNLAETINRPLIFILFSGLVVCINHFQVFKDKTYLLQKLLVEGFFLSYIYLISQNFFIVFISHLVFNIINLLKYYKYKNL